MSCYLFIYYLLSSCLSRSLKNRYTNSYLFLLGFSQVNNSIIVNSVNVPDSDLMATNGVIHVVKNVLYPGGEINIHSCSMNSVEGCILFS